MKLTFPKKTEYRHLGLMVSGGADSTALLIYCAENAEAIADEITVYTFDHRLRGEEGAKDALFVKDLCARYSLPVKTFLLPVTAYADLYGMGTEEAARALRYRVMRHELSKNSITHAVTAHHLGDQAETVLFRLLRGTGTKGAIGIHPNRERFLRPMLSVSKEEILAYLTEKSQPFRTDETNADGRFTRNFLRGEIFPLLKTRFPQAEKNLASFAETLAADEELLTRLAAPYLTEENEILPCAERSLFTRAALLGLARLGITADYEKEHLTRLYALQSAPVGTREQLPNSVTAERTRTGVLLYAVESAFPMARFTAGEFSFPFGKCKIEKITLSHPFTAEKGALYLDADLLPTGAVLRPKERGDAFIPFGHTAKKKVKDFFADKKLNGKQKGEALVLATESTLYAVLPYEIADCVKVTEKTQAAWKITVAMNADGPSPR